MDKIKDRFDVIYLLDAELGIDSGHDNERPCLVIEVYDDGSGIVVPVTSQRPITDNNSKWQLAFGSWIDLSNRPIRVNEAQMTYARLADFEVDGEDIDEIEYRYQEWIGNDDY